MLQIFVIIKGTSVMNFGTNPQHDFPKMRAGSKAAWNFSENSSVLGGGCFPIARIVNFRLKGRYAIHHITILPVLSLCSCHTDLLAFGSQGTQLGRCED